MASQPVQPYQRDNVPPLPGSEKEFLERELRKLENTIRDLVAAVKQLQAVVNP